MDSGLDAFYRRMLSRVSGLVFCGCPHRGSNVLSWSKLKLSFISASVSDSRAKLLSDLKVDPDVLELIQDDFLKTLRRSLTHPAFRIHSFQEARAVTGMVGMNDRVSVPACCICLHPRSDDFLRDRSSARCHLRSGGRKRLSSLLRRITGTWLENLVFKIYLVFCKSLRDYWMFPRKVCLS